MSEEDLPYKVGDYVDYGTPNGSSYLVKYIEQIPSSNYLKVSDPRPNVQKVIEIINIKTSKLSLYRRDSEIKAISPYSSMSMSVNVRVTSINKEQYNENLERLRDFDLTLETISPKYIIQFLRGKHYYFMEGLLCTTISNEEQFNLVAQYFNQHLKFVIKYFSLVNFQNFDKSEDIYQSKMNAFCSAYLEIMDLTLTIMNVHTTQIITNLSTTNPNFQNFKKDNSRFIPKNYFEHLKLEWIENQLLPTLQNSKNKIMPLTLIMQFYQLILTLLKRSQIQRSLPIQCQIQNLYNIFIESLKIHFVERKDIIYFIGVQDQIFELFPQESKRQQILIEPTFESRESTVKLISQEEELEIEQNKMKEQDAEKLKQDQSNKMVIEQPEKHQAESNHADNIVHVQGEKNQTVEESKDNQYEVENQFQKEENNKTFREGPQNKNYHRVIDVSRQFQTEKIHPQENNELQMEPFIPVVFEPQNLKQLALQKQRQGQKIKQKKIEKMKDKQVEDLFIKNKKMQFRVKLLRILEEKNNFKQLINELSSLTILLGQEHPNTTSLTVPTQPYFLTKSQNLSPSSLHLIQYIRQQNLIELIIKLQILNQSEPLKQILIRLIRFFPVQIIREMVHANKVTFMKYFYTKMDWQYLTYFLDLVDEKLSNSNLEEINLKEYFDIFVHLQRGCEQMAYLNTDQRLSLRQRCIQWIYNFMPKYLTYDASVSEYCINSSTNDMVKYKIHERHMEKVLSDALINQYDHQNMYNEFMISHYIKRKNVDQQLFHLICQFLIVDQFKDSCYEKRKSTVLNILHALYKDNNKDKYFQYLAIFLTFYSNRIDLNKTWGINLYLLASETTNDNFFYHLNNMQYCQDNLQKLLPLQNQFEITLFLPLFKKYNYYAGNYVQVDSSNDNYQVVQPMKYMKELYLAVKEVDIKEKIGKILMQQIQGLITGTVQEHYEDSVIEMAKTFLERGVVKEAYSIFARLRQRSHMISSLSASAFASLRNSGASTLNLANVSMSNALSAYKEQQLNTSMKIHVINLTIRRNIQEKLALYKHDKYRTALLHQEYRKASHQIDIRLNCQVQILKFKIASMPNYNIQPKKIKLYYQNELISQEKMKSKFYNFIYNESQHQAENTLSKPEEQMSSIKIVSSKNMVEFSYEVEKQLSKIDYFLLDHILDIFQHLPATFTLLKSINLQNNKEIWKTHPSLQILEHNFQKYFLPDQSLPHQFRSSPTAFNFLLDYYIDTFDDELLAKLKEQDEAKGLKIIEASQHSEEVAVHISRNSYTFLLQLAQPMKKYDDLRRNMKILYLIYRSTGMNLHLCDYILRGLLPAQTSDDERQSKEEVLTFPLYHYFNELSFRIVSRYFAIRHHLYLQDMHELQYNKHQNNEQITGQSSQHQMKNNLCESLVQMDMNPHCHLHALDYCFTFTHLSSFRENQTVYLNFMKYWKEVYLSTTLPEKEMHFNQFQFKIYQFPLNWHYFCQILSTGCVRELEVQYFAQLIQRIVNFLIDISPRSWSGNDTLVIAVMMHWMATLLDCDVEDDSIFKHQFSIFLIKHIYDFNQDSRESYMKIVQSVMNHSERRSQFIDFFDKEIREKEWICHYRHLMRPKRKMFQQNNLVGLKNPHSVCYVNSLLQQLFHIVPFRERLLMSEWNNTENIEEQDLILQLKFMFIHLKEQRQPFINYNFFKAFKNIEGENTPIDVQMDVDEFRNVLLDRIEKLLPKDNNLIQQIFNGKQTTIIKSQECIHQSRREEQFSSLCLDVKGFDNLLDSLQAYFKPQILEGDNAYECEDCKKKVKAQKRIQIKEYPLNLTFVLKRFEYMVYHRSKVNSYLKFPLQSLIIDSGIVYKLKGVIIHQGVSEAGHYISLVKYNGHWYEFNDSYVSEITQETVAEMTFGHSENHASSNYYQNKNAYLLFYQKVVPKDQNMIEEEPQILAQERQKIYQGIDKYYGVENQIKKIRKAKIINDKEKTYFEPCFLRTLNIIVRKFKEEQSVSLLLNTLTIIFFKMQQQCYQSTIFDSIKVLEEIRLINVRNSNNQRGLQLENQENNRNGSGLMERMMEFIENSTNVRYKTILVTIIVDNIQSSIHLKTNALTSDVQQFLDQLIQKLYKENKDNHFIYDIMLKLCEKDPLICHYLNQKRIIGRILDLVLTGVLGEKVRQELKRITDLPFETSTTFRVTGKDAFRTEYKYYKWKLLCFLIEKSQLKQHQNQKKHYIMHSSPLIFKSILEEAISKPLINYISRYLCFLAKKDQNYQKALLSYISENLIKEKGDELRKYLKILKDLLNIDDQQKQSRTKNCILIFSKAMKKFLDQKIDNCFDYVWQWFLKIAMKNEFFRIKVRQFANCFEWLEKITMNNFSQYRMRDREHFKIDKSKNKYHGLQFSKNKIEFEFLFKDKMEKTLELLKTGFIVPREDGNEDWDSDGDVTTMPLPKETQIMRYNENLMKYELIEVKAVIGDFIIISQTVNPLITQRREAWIERGNERLAHYFKEVEYESEDMEDGSSGHSNENSDDSQGLNNYRK